MAKILLNKYYPELYKTETISYVPKRIKKQLESERKNLENQRRQKYRNHAQYTLDINDKNIESQIQKGMIPFEEILEEEELINELKVMLLKLEELQRKRLLEYYFQNKTLSQIADEQNVSITSVRKSIYRAINQIRKYFL